jgi:hypothetical protein
MLNEALDRDLFAVCKPEPSQPRVQANLTDLDPLLTLSPDCIICLVQ